ncbi:type II toxin-antitoxin system VapC family toxin [Candidatus Peregrinibacteria bacterium]|nr:type II toxin-antitoxin system VapC family toxin [Candidatus Peregrinibacteria bacterium]
MVANKPLLVVDASVILKWFLHETTPGQNEALLLRQDFLLKKIFLAYPHYALAEVFNIMSLHFPHNKALSAFSQLFNFRIHDYPITLELASLALEITSQFTKVSFYDAGYHALALQNGGTFITADKAYYVKTRKKGHILLLDQYEKFKA